MPIQIGKYFVPIDFVIVDMEEDTQTPLLLGRPFLNTAKAILDAHEGMIFFKIGKEKITFHVNRAMKYPSNGKSIFSVEIIDILVQEKLQRDANERSLENIFDNLDLATESEQIGPNPQFLRDARSLTREPNIRSYMSRIIAWRRKSLRAASHCTKSE
jgi:hypothetical protein